MTLGIDGLDLSDDHVDRCLDGITTSWEAAHQLLSDWNDENENKENLVRIKKYCFQK